MVGIVGRAGNETGGGDGRGSGGIRTRIITLHAQRQPLACPLARDYIRKRLPPVVEYSFDSRRHQGGDGLGDHENACLKWFQTGIFMADNRKLLFNQFS